MHHASPVLAGTRTDVDDPVCRPDRVLVVLDDDERVPEVAQTRERLDQTSVVPLVEADARLVQHVQDADETGADLRRQPDPLRLPPAQRPGRAHQGEVVEAHIEEEAETRLDLLEHLRGDRPFPFPELERVQEMTRFAERELTDLGDRLAADAHREHLGLQPSALAHGARHLAHERFVLLLRPVRLGLAVATFEERHDALESGRVLPLTTPPVPVANLHLVVLAEQHGVLGSLGQCTPRHVHREPQVPGQCREHAREVLG